MPIGINFLPSDEQAMQGPKQANMEGDLGQAFKILSLRLQRRPDVRGISPLPTEQAPGIGAGAMSPMAAVIQALLRGMGGGPMPSGLQATVRPGDLGSIGAGIPHQPGGERTVSEPTIDRSMPGTGNRDTNAAPLAGMRSPFGRTRY